MSSLLLFAMQHLWSDKHNHCMPLACCLLMLAGNASACTERRFSDTAQLKNATWCEEAPVNTNYTAHDAAIIDQRIIQFDVYGRPVSGHVVWLKNPLKHFSAVPPPQGQVNGRGREGERGRWREKERERGQARGHEREVKESTDQSISLQVCCCHQTGCGGGFSTVSNTSAHFEVVKHFQRPARLVQPPWKRKPSDPDSVTVTSRVNGCRIAVNAGFFNTTS